MKKSAVVIGDTGLIGNAVATQLNAIGYEVTGASRRSYTCDWQHQATSNWIHDANVRTALKAADVVFLMDGFDGGSTFKRDQGDQTLHYSANAVELANSLLAFAQPRKMVMCSSMDVERTAKLEISPYVRGKLKIEEFAIRCREEAMNTEVISVRIGNTFGIPDLTGIERGRLIPTWCDAALRRRELHIFGDQNQNIELFWNFDVAQSMIQLGTSEIVARPVSKIPANIGHHVSLGSLRDLILAGSAEPPILLDRSKNSFEKNEKFFARLSTVKHWVKEVQGL